MTYQPFGLGIAAAFVALQGLLLSGCAHAPATDDRVRVSTWAVLSNCPFDAGTKHPYVLHLKMASATDHHSDPEVSVLILIRDLHVARKSSPIWQVKAYHVLTDDDLSDTSFPISFGRQFSDSAKKVPDIMSFRRMKLKSCFWPGRKDKAWRGSHAVR